MSLLNQNPLSLAVFEKFDRPNRSMPYTFPRGEYVTAMKQDGDRLFVCTNRVLYEVVSGVLIGVDLAVPCVGCA